MAAAVPKYVGGSFAEAPPGHKFKLYFDCWDHRTWERQQMEKPLRSAASMPESARKGLSALRARQAHMAVSLGDVLTLHVKTRAPLVTGTGSEHPTENGFAFLDPHGLPYLPGSSVKGAVRRAAEELALFDGDSSWTLPVVWALFGIDATAAYLRPAPRQEPPVAREEREHWREAYRKHIDELADGDLGLARELFSLGHTSDVASYLRALPGSRSLEDIRRRGALVFWDAYPECSTLEVDVMTPHFSNYYQTGKPPSDDGDPTPIYFLAIPADATLSIHVEWRPPSASCPLSEHWKDLVGSALDHAVDWLGLGAKTTSGYGRAERDAATERRIAAERERELEARREQERRRARERELEALGPAGRLVAELDHCDENRAHQIYKELEDDGGGLDEEGVRAVAAALKDAYIRLGKWSGKQSAKQKAKVAKIRQLLGE